MKRAARAEARGSLKDIEKRRMLCKGETAFCKQLSGTAFRDIRRESVNFNFLADLNLVTTDVKLVSSNEGLVPRYGKKIGGRGIRTTGEHAGTLKKSIFQPEIASSTGTHQLPWTTHGNRNAS